MAIRMNEIFPFLACYSQKLMFLFGNRDTSPVKESGENKIGTILLKKWYLYSVSTSSCLWSFANNYTVHLLYYTSLLRILCLYRIHCDFQDLNGQLKNGFN